MNEEAEKAILQYQEGAITLEELAHFLFYLVHPCPHVVTFPQEDKEVCMDCGQTLA